MHPCGLDAPDLPYVLSAVAVSPLYAGLPFLFGDPQPEKVLEALVAKKSTGWQTFASLAVCESGRIYARVNTACSSGLCL